MWSTDDLLSCHPTLKGVQAGGGSLPSQAEQADVVTTERAHAGQGVFSPEGQHLA